MKLKASDFKIENLGNCEFESPLHLSKVVGDSEVNYTTDDRRVLLNNVVDVGYGKTTVKDVNFSFELAGPREKIYFHPGEVTCGIVTCGGLCPGINNVIRAIVMRLFYGYGVKRTIGFRFGFLGLIPDYRNMPIDLTPDVVSNINERGGTILGSSRGPQDIKKMVDTLENLRIDCLFVIGGDGSLRGGNALQIEINKRKLNKCIIGLPKTIDNDLMYIEQTFGFETAFSEAARAIRSAHIEASDAPYGVGLVKLMGRHSGYVAAYAALALREVNLVLIPEQEFSIEAVCRYTEHRLKTRGHIVIVVAEGAGQNHFREDLKDLDASGNAKLKNIGLLMKDSIRAYFKNKGVEINLKYIDPSYMIRSTPAQPTDAVFTGSLGEYAVDAAMCGKSGLAVGFWKGYFTHLPLALATKTRNQISLEGELWRSVLESTGQPKNLRESKA